MNRDPRPPQHAVASWQRGYLALLPAIETYARSAFRRMDAEGREEAVQEAVCNAMVAYMRLFRLGKVELAYPGVLARYAVAQTRDHRKVGGRLNSRDVASGYCQRRKGLVVERLDGFSGHRGAWREVLIEDRRAGPAEVAAVRMDFAAWLEGLPRRMAEIATFLAAGQTTGHAAREFGVSSARISQLRRELRRSWRTFQDEADAASQTAGDV